MRRRANLTIAERAERERHLAQVRVAPQPLGRLLAPAPRPILGLELLAAGKLTGAAADLIRSIQQLHNLHGGVPTNPGLTINEICERALKLSAARRGAITNYRDTYRALIPSLLEDGVLVDVGRAYCDGGGCETLYALSGLGSQAQSGQAARRKRR